MFMLSNLLFKYITIHHAAILKNTLYCNGKFIEMVLSRLVQLFVLILFPGFQGVFSFTVSAVPLSLGSKLDANEQV